MLEAEAAAKGRELTKTEAKRMVAALPYDDREDALFGLVMAIDAGIAPFMEIEGRAERQMKGLARTLPGSAFVAVTRGFGEVSFARIIGETGPLHIYANPAKVWKRLGLGLVGGERQRRHRDPVLAAAHGYNPRRRSVSWVAMNALLRCQAMTPEPGPYRVLYDQAKERYLARPGWTRMHAHRAAARYAEKRLIRNLWRAWRDALGTAEPKAA